MKPYSSSSLVVFSLALASALGCGKPAAPAAATPAPAQQQIPIFHVDPATAGSIHGVIRYSGPRPAAKLIDMSEDPACVGTYKGKAKPRDQSLVVGPHDGLANAFVYIDKGLEGKNFAVPKTPVILDQSGCWFRPRVLGIQTNQTLEIINSDPVTHNIHPMPVVNREWNHSQGPGDPPVDRHFTKAEVMIPVKCNIHSWMHAFIGVLDNPYFAVTKEDGSFELPNLPPGNYVVKVWQEKLGTQELPVTVTASSAASANFVFRGK